MEIERTELGGIGGSNIGSSGGIGAANEWVQNRSEAKFIKKTDFKKEFKKAFGIFNSFLPIPWGLKNLSYQHLHIHSSVLLKLFAVHIPRFYPNSRILSSKRTLGSLFCCHIGNTSLIKLTISFRSLIFLYNSFKLCNITVHNVQQF